MRDHTISDNLWITKDGASVAIEAMTDQHLFNAYKLTGDKDLFKEMVFRLFKMKLSKESRGKDD